MERSGTPVSGHPNHQLTPLGVTDCVSITYCRPDGAWTCVLNSCRGFTRLRLVAPLPMPCSPLAGLFPGHLIFNIRLASWGAGVSPLVIHRVFFRQKAEPRPMGQVVRCLAWQGAVVVSGGPGLCPGEGDITSRRGCGRQRR